CFVPARFLHGVVLRLTGLRPGWFEKPEDYATSFFNTTRGTTAQDAVELYNATSAPVDLTGWQIQVYVNDDTQPQAARIYAFTSFTLNPGDAVAVYERGDETQNGQHHLYAGTAPEAFNASWNAGLDGACVLRDASSQAVDFVKWRAASGMDNNTPVPSG